MAPAQLAAHKTNPQTLAYCQQKIVGPVGLDKEATVMY